MPDSTQQRWNKIYTTRRMVPTLEFAQKVCAFLPRKEQCSILDVGCGDGRDALYFAEQGLAVTAIDFSEEAIRRLKSENPSIHASVMDIRHLDFPDASFDAVYAHLIPICNGNIIP